jgi:hypothetical protein
MVSGTLCRYDVPVRDDVEASGGGVSMLVFTIVVGTKAPVAAQCRVANFATHLTRYFVVVAMPTSTTSAMATTETSITTAAHRAVTTPSTVKGRVDSDLPLFLLRFNLCFCGKKL